MTLYKISYDDFARIITTNSSLLRIFQTSAIPAPILSRCAKSLLTLSSIGTMSVLVYKLIQKEIEDAKVNQEKQIFHRVSVSRRVVDLLIRKTCGRYMRSILEPSIRSLIDAEVEENMEIDVTKYSQDLTLDEVEIEVEKSVDNLTLLCRSFTSAIFNEESVKTLPLEIKAAARYIKEVATSHGFDPTPFIGSLIFSRVFSPCIVFPDKRKIRKSNGKITLRERRILLVVTKVFDKMAKQQSFTDADGLAVMNNFIIEFRPFCDIYLNSICANDKELKELHDRHSQFLQRNIKSGLVATNPKLLSEAHVLQYVMESYYEQIVDKALKFEGLPNEEEEEDEGEDSENQSGLMARPNEIVYEDTQTFFAVQNSLPPLKVKPKLPTVQEEEEVLLEDILKETSYKTQTVDSGKAGIKYRELIEKAKEMNMEDLDRLHILRFPGLDKDGRPLAIFYEPKLKTSEQQKRLLSYLLLRLDEFTKSDYTLVLCMSHEKTKGSKKPGIRFFINSYNCLPRHVRKNIKGLYVIHPNSIFNFLMRLVRPFIKKKFWRKFHVCENMLDADDAGRVPLGDTPLPPAVLTRNIQKFFKDQKPEEPVFQVTIEQVMKKECNRNRRFPLFLTRYIKYIRTKLHAKGIFRKAGNTTLMNELKEIANWGYYPDYVFCDFHSVGGVVKLWFRELKNPLFTSEMYKDFISFKPQEHEFDVLKALMDRLKETHPAHWDCSAVIFQFLFDISELSEQNMMTPTNLAICFGPNCLRSSKDKMSALMDNNQIVAVVAYVIQYAYYLFEEQINIFEEVVDKVGNENVQEEEMKKKEELQKRRKRRRVRDSHRSSHLAKMDVKMLNFALTAQNQNM